MPSRTTIIESNRRISYNKQQEAILSGNSSLDVLEQIKFSNSEWTTHLNTGHAVKAGDQINLEAAMINATGSGDSVQEFIGDTGLNYNGKKLYDNAIQLNLAYYITNRFQFNFNLPTQHHNTNYNFLQNDYGMIAFQSGSILHNGTETDIENFECWRSSYPYQCIEGFSMNANIIPRFFIIAHANTKPSIMKPPIELNVPSDIRLYIGNERFTGGNYMGEDPADYKWQFAGNKTILSVQLGFSTPAAVGQVVTSQLHNRFGSAEEWDSERVEPCRFDFAGGDNPQGTTTLLQTKLPAITDATYMTYPTSTGKMFYKRLKNEWHSAFEGEVDIAGNNITAGTGFLIAEARKVYYERMMSATPYYYKAACYFMSMIQPFSWSSATNTPFPDIIPDGDFTIQTGKAWPPQDERIQEYRPNNYITEPFKCGLIQPHMVYTDRGMPAIDRQQTFYDNISELQVTETCSCMNLVSGNPIPTNLSFNAYTLKVCANALQSHFEVISSTTNTSITNQAFLDAHIVKLYHGRIDDTISTPYNNRMAMLSSPYIYATQQWGLNSAYEIQRITDNTGATSDRPVLKGNITGHDCSIYTKLYLNNSTYNADNAFNNSIIGCESLYPHNADSFFMTKPPDGDKVKLKALWDLIPNINTGARVAIIPVFYKDFNTADSYTGANGFNVPFCAFLYHDDGYLLRPDPEFGEFFGYSLQEITCQLSQIATTQKKYNETPPNGYPQPYPSDNVPPVAGDMNASLPQQYMPYVYAGAMDAKINFDDGLSRFAISDFHTPAKVGNGAFQNPTEPEPVNPFQDIMRVNETESFMCNLFTNGVPQCYTDIVAVPLKQPVISAQAGIAILDYDIILNVGLPIEQSPTLRLNIGNSPYYKGTLFDKMGFDWEQICPFYGEPQNQFNRSNHNKYLGFGEEVDILIKFENMVKPFTTNAYISSAEQISFGQMMSISKTTANPPVLEYSLAPCENLGGCMIKPSTTNATSDELLATRMPSKLDYPYLVVYSDIVRTTPSWFGGREGSETLSAIAYLTRNYTQGDFFYSFTTNWNYTADIDYVITSIKTRICLPTGQHAPIDDNSSVIYKIVSPAPIPELPDPKK
tara:strand:- start:6604 stop:9894 length:3291 start_codon:yes stop_codon:yes gene_type:complete